MKILKWLFGTDRETLAGQSSYGERPFVAACIEAFNSGPIVKRDLNSHGISYLAVRLPDDTVVTASWYDGILGPRDLSVNGNRHTTRHGEGNRIIRAAMRRADRLFVEETAELDAKYSTPKKPPQP